MGDKATPPYKDFRSGDDMTDEITISYISLSEMQGPLKLNNV